MPRNTHAVQNSIQTSRSQYTWNGAVCSILSTSLRLASSSLSYRFSASSCQSSLEKKSTWRSQSYWHLLCSCYELVRRCRQLQTRFPFSVGDYQLSYGISSVFFDFEFQLLKFYQSKYWVYFFFYFTLAGAKPLLWVLWAKLAGPKDDITWFSLSRHDCLAWPLTRPDSVRSDFYLTADYVSSYFYRAIESKVLNSYTVRPVANNSLKKKLVLFTSQLKCPHIHPVSTVVYLLTPQMGCYLHTLVTFIVWICRRLVIVYTIIRVKNSRKCLFEIV